MTMLTQIYTPPPPPIRHPNLDRAERMAACSAVVGEMLADAAGTLDTAASTAWECRAGLYQQARLRMIGVALLLDELDRLGEDTCRTIATEIADIAGTRDPGLVRDIATRLDAAISIELHQIRIGMSYDRYV